MEIGLLIVALILLGSLLLFLFLGIPIGFAMGGISIIFGLIFWGGLPSLDGFVLGTFSKLTQAVLVALPLYIFMAAILMYSDLADDLYEFVYRWFGGIKGGLAAGTTIIASLFAAMVGTSSVATATLGLVARPSMLKRKYDDKLTLGVIMAGGTLGILIPPSIVMIIYAAETGVSTGALFIAGLVPGILAALIFITYCFILCFIKPELGPSIPIAERFTLREKFQSLPKVVLPLLLIVIVLGSIYLGLATPTEAGAVGAIGALIVAGVNRKLSFENIKKILKMTVRINGFIFWILIGAVAYARIITVTGVGKMFANAIVNMDVNRWIILILILILLLIAGMFMDTIAILLISAPFIVPAFNAMNFDLVWFGILFVLATMIGNLTPPVGLSIFIMKGISNDIKLSTVYAAVWPFVFLLLLVTALIIVFPDIALWLPDLMM